MYDDTDMNPRRIERNVQRNGSRLVIVDYLQLMVSDNQQGFTNREREIAQISRSFKNTATKYKLPIIALSQLSRKVEERTKNMHRPILSDLRESGTLEQDADTVMFLYRPHYYKDTIDTEDVPEGFTEVIIAKQRSGKIDKVSLKFDESHACFTNEKTIIQESVEEEENIF